MIIKVYQNKHCHLIRKFKIDKDKDLVQMTIENPKMKIMLKKEANNLKVQIYKQLKEEILYLTQKVQQMYKLIMNKNLTKHKILVSMQEVFQKIIEKEYSNFNEIKKNQRRKLCK